MAVLMSSVLRKEYLGLKAQGW